MIDISVVHDKLRNFETADELADYFMSLGIKAEKQNAVACPISRYVMMETGLDTVSTSIDCLTVYRPDGDGLAFCEAHTVAMTEFVDRFDHGAYPDLVEQVEWWDIG